MKRIETTAKAVGIDVHHIRIQAPADVGDALVLIAKGREGLVVLEDAMINICSAQIAEVAAKHRSQPFSGCRLLRRRVD